MASFYDRVKMSVASAPGTGAVTLGSAVAGYRTFDAAGVPDQGTVSYAIEDGGNWEIGHGTYTKSGTSLARTTILGSSNNNAAIAASSAAVLYLTFLAADIAALGTAVAAAAGSAVSIVQVSVAPGGVASLANPATKGNLLVMAVFDGGSQWETYPSDYTELVRSTSSRDGVTVSYKVATGGEQTYSFNHPPYSSVVWELSGAIVANMSVASVLDATGGTSVITGKNGIVLGLLASEGTASPVATAPAGTTTDAGSANGTRSLLAFHANPAAGSNAYAGTFDSSVTFPYTVLIGVDAANTGS